MEDSLYTRDSCHTTEDIRTSHSSQNQSIKVHPFMTSTRREEGARLRWMHADWGMVSSMWMSTHTHTIRAQRRHPVFFSCKEVGIFSHLKDHLDKLKKEFGSDPRENS